MKKSKFTESQIIGYLRRMEQGEKTADLCREAGVSQGTMYQWKSKYSGMEVSQLKKLKATAPPSSLLELVVPTDWGSSGGSYSVG